MGFAGAGLADEHVDLGREIQCQAGEDREVFQFKTLDHI
jgi:hypothetical protein